MEATTVSVVAAVVVVLEEVCCRNVHSLARSAAEVAAALVHTAAEQLLERVAHKLAAADSAMADSVAEQAVSPVTVADLLADSVAVVCTVAGWPAVLAGSVQNWLGSFRSLDCVVSIIRMETKYRTRLTQVSVTKQLVADKHQVTLTLTTRLADHATS